MDMAEGLIRNMNDSVVNVKRIFASSVDFESSKVEDLKENWNRRERCISEPIIGYSVNYDDLCGPWRYPDNPAHARRDDATKPRLCLWQQFDRDSVNFVKNFGNDEKTIKRVIENCLSRGNLNVGTNKNVALEMAWSIVKFARENLFDEERFSTILGIFFLTYHFFLSNPWRTSRETYHFFYRTLLLHAVENPPKSMELFTPEECEKCLKYFETIMLRHLPLIRFVSIPNYRLTFSNE